MIPQSLYREDALLLLLGLIVKMALPHKMQRVSVGRKQYYDDRVFLKATVIMTLKRLNKVFELLSSLQEPTQAMQRLRQHLLQEGKLPSRRTFEKRLSALSEKLPDVSANGPSPPLAH